MTKIAVNWNTAYNTILITQNDLKKSFLNHSEDSVNISFLVKEIKEFIWWNWLNIAYNLALLWEKTKLFTAVWNDFEFNDFFKNNIDLSWVYYSKTNKTARSFISTDEKKSYITSFYLWAILDSNKIACEVKNDEKIDYAIVSASSKEAMIEKLEAFKNTWAKTFFDPGSQVINMNKEELYKAFKNTNYLIVNQIEFEHIKKISELTDWELIESFDKIIITYWLKWSKIFDRNYYLDEVEWVENPNELDSTWCSDAYKAGLISGIKNWYSWKTSARVWAILASLCAWYIWPENHKTSWEELEKLYKDTFWEELE